MQEMTSNVMRKVAEGVAYLCMLLPRDIQSCILFDYF